MQELTEKTDAVSKEIRLGIFDAKTNVYLPKTELEKIEKRTNLSEIFGEESIPYIENYELLKERIQSLINFTKAPKEMQQLDELLQQLNIVETLMNQQNRGMLDLLKQIPNNSIDLIYCDILYGTDRNFGDYQDLSYDKKTIGKHQRI